MKVLVVDDCSSMRTVVRFSLRRCEIAGGVTIAEACNGVDALELMAQQSPDLVISDWNMPEMTGIELLEELRRIGLSTPFGFITAENRVELKARARDAGADFFLGKPFDVAELRREVKRMRGAYGSLRGIKHPNWLCLTGCDGP